ncbi:hypothetical protein BJ875DRAFT_529390, partial [Amylocarpus encephaloides]
WIEYTSQPYAIKNFYKGYTAAHLSSGGVGDLPTDTSIDLAANAETQGLKHYANHKNIRLIYIIVEVGYRIVANKASGITKLADLKGKKVRTFRGSSAEVFMDKMLASVGVPRNASTHVSGSVCMKAPCASGTYPQLLASKQIDAFGLWEPIVELGLKAIGENAAIFQNFSIYREVYSLYSTTEKLGNTKTRKDIVAFAKALKQTSDVYVNKPELVYQYVAGLSGMDASVVQDVWPDHRWGNGTMPDDLLEFLVEEDAYLAKMDKRVGVSRADLAKFIDTSVL